MDHTIATAGTLVRVSIVSEDRRLDIGIPGQVPLVELLPGFARSLGVLDPSFAHGGYSLNRAGGELLDPSKSATAHGVHDGELLTLVRGGLLAEARIYDDVVEAVIDATAEQHGAWTAQDNARTALAISLSFLALCAILLLAARDDLEFGWVIASGGALLLLATATALTRLQQPEAGNAFGLASAAFGGLTGYLLMPSAELWGWPLAAPGLGMLIVGGLSLALTQDNPEAHLIPVVFGAVLALTASLTALFFAGSADAFALMIALAAGLSNGLPWLALSSTRITVISAQSDVEIFAPPEPIDALDVRRRAAAGQRVLVSLRVALGLSVLLATPFVAASGPSGAALCSLAFVGMMFLSRQSYARLGVVALMSIGSLGLVTTGLSVSATQPAIRPLLLALLLCTTVILVILTLLSPRSRLRLARAADTLEVMALALLLPLGVASLS
jgi:type VII secretion integral membrane protein EccD